MAKGTKLKMGDKTGISWTDRTWNPWRGCKMVSPGCANCYMFRDQRRYGFDPTIVTRTKPNIWNKPLKWQKEAVEANRRDLIFTCSWSDWFIGTADPWRDEAWDIARKCPNLIFQILTKRPENISSRLPHDWGSGWDNVALGVSVENEDFLGRIDILRQIPSKVRFVSAEPLLGPLSNINLKGIHWLISGGESGPDFREMDLDWVRELRDICKEEGVAFFHKQGSSFKPGQDEMLDGVLHHDFPAIWMS